MCCFVMSQLKQVKYVDTSESGNKIGTYVGRGKWGKLAVSFFLENDVSENWRHTSAPF